LLLQCIIKSESEREAMAGLGPKPNPELEAAREERARRNELRLRLALRAVPMISFEWDIVRDVVRRFDPFISDLAPSTGMFSRFAAVRDAVHPEDRERFCADIEAALRGETERFETVIRVLSPDGTVTWFRELGIVERDQMGRPLRMIGVAHDITAQRDNEALQPAVSGAATLTPSLKALVIDADRNAADRFALLLSTVGACVRLAYNGAAGLNALKDFTPKLVFLDISMPFMDVNETVRRIRTLPTGDQIPLVALAASDSQRIVALVKNAGFDDLLAKPPRFEGLLDLIEKLS
jgi:CheY-like chemotaxis protein